jgi:chemotaxis protein CheY-P-specific phosphatase CheC
VNEIFTADELSFLSKLIEAGVQLSGERLAKLSGTKWNVVSASVEVVPIVRALSIFHNEPVLHIGAHMRSQSLLPLEFLMLFPDWSAEPIADVITKASPAMKALPERNKVIVGEIANILGQGVVKAMADTFNLSIILSVPQISTGRKAELTVGVLEKFDGRKDTVVLTHVEMYADTLSAVCSMLLMLDAAVVKRLITLANKPENA